MPIVSSTANDVLITGFDEQGKDHDATLDRVVRVCRQTNLNLNKDKHLFRCTSIPFLWKRTSTTRHATAKTQERWQSFLGKLNYLSKFSPETADVCEPL